MKTVTSGKEDSTVKRAKKLLLDGRCYHEIKLQKPDSDGYYGSARCAHCNAFGFEDWYCPKSPDHVCHYFSESDGSRRYVEDINGEKIYLSKKHTDEDAQYETDDVCLFCGNPLERK
jgi:hypothetical protein